MVIVTFLLGVVAFFIYINDMDINLVEDNYYEEELVYQDRIDKINNVSELPGKINISSKAGMIIIQFPALDTVPALDGSLMFYRPSDPWKDFSIPLQLDDSLRQALDVSMLKPGKWIIKIDWEMGGKEYYFEESVILSH